MRKVLKLLRSQRGDMNIYVLMAFLFTVLIIVVSAMAFVWRFWLIKSHSQNALKTALQVAANESTPASVAHMDSGVNNIRINQTAAQNLFNAELQALLTWPPYSVDMFIVYSELDKGKPMPGNWPGTIPGAGIYAHITLAIPLSQTAAKWLGLSQPVIYMPLDYFACPNRYSEPQKQWQGG
ncbi:MAG: hypothetical protein ACOY81_03925 [Bacillota bacterium]